MPRRAFLQVALPILLIALAPPGFADSGCDCVDAYDIASRRAEASAAIQAYLESIRQWSSSGAPQTTDEDVRRAFQEREIKPALKRARYPNATPASAVTGPDLIGRCTTENSSPSACMKESTDVHESVHVAQCNSSGHRRWNDLEEYAREEVSAYQEELAWLKREYQRLQSECEFELTFQSTILGSNTLSKSTVKAKVPLRLDDNGYYAGEGLLDYQTVETGPPRRVVGEATLARLMLDQCKVLPYYAWEGSGFAPISVPRSALMWAQDPATGNRHVFVELALHVGETREILRLKDRKNCLPPAEEKEGAFWSEAFYSDKSSRVINGERSVDFNDWYVPGSKDSFAEAEFVIRGDATNFTGAISTLKSSEETRLFLRRN